LAHGRGIEPGSVDGETTMTRGLAAGFARADITPAPGIHMGGYWGRTSGATGVHDPLWARALVLGSGVDRIGLVALDLAADAVGACRQVVGLPLIDPPPLAKMVAEKAVLELKAEVAGRRQGRGDLRAQLVPRARLQWAEEMLDLEVGSRQALETLAVSEP